MGDNLRWGLAALLRRHHDTRIHTAGDAPRPPGARRRRNEVHTIHLHEDARTGVDGVDNPLVDIKLGRRGPANRARSLTDIDEVNPQPSPFIANAVEESGILDNRVRTPHVLVRVLDTDTPVESVQCGYGHPTQTVIGLPPGYNASACEAGVRPLSCVSIIGDQHYPLGDVGIGVADAN